MSLSNIMKKEKKLKPGKYKCPKCEAFVAIVDQFKQYNDPWFKKHCRYFAYCKRCGDREEGPVRKGKHL